MIKFEVNNVELEFDIFEVESAEKYQQGLQNVISATEKTETIDDVGVAFRMQCAAVFDFIDLLFGEGKSKKLFGESVNVKSCILAFQKIISEIDKDKDSISQIIPMPNKAQWGKKK